MLECIIRQVYQHNVCGTYTALGMNSMIKSPWTVQCIGIPKIWDKFVSDKEFTKCKTLSSPESPQILLISHSNLFQVFGQR